MASPVLYAVASFSSSCCSHRCRHAAHEDTFLRNSNKTNMRIHVNNVFTLILVANHTHPLPTGHGVEGLYLSSIAYGVRCHLQHYPTRRTPWNRRLYSSHLDGGRQQHVAALCRFQLASRWMLHFPSCSRTVGESYAAKRTTGASIHATTAAPATTASDSSTPWMTSENQPISGSINVFLMPSD